MLRNMLILICTAAMLAFTTAGCKKSEPKEEPQVKTMEEYQKEAAEEITEENMDEELEKIEKELNAEEQ